MKRCYQCFHEYDSEYNNCPYCGYSEETVTAEPQYLRPGSILLNRYLIGTVVGAGGFGITYAAWDKVLEQKVAIKEYLPGEFSTRMPGNTEVTVYGGEKTEQFREGRDKFLEESKRLAKMQKIPGIVQIYNSFAENGTAYIVMEYLEGETLSSRLDREKKIPEQEAVKIVISILQALEEVHKAGILHRDIAPNNIFLTNKGEVKLLDFGAARSATGSHSKSLTVLYKEGYTPEEQYRSRGDQGPWTDVYACAATLYKMLTGNVPPGALERRCKDSLKEPSKSGARISHGVDVAVMNALNVDVKNRTPSAEKFIEELTSGKAKSHYVRTEEKKAGKIPAGMKIGALLFMGAMMLFWVLISTGVISFGNQAFVKARIPEGMTRIPNVINCSIEEAQTKTEEAGLSFMIIRKQFSLEIPENRILSQEIKAGELIEKGAQLEVIISAGVNNMTAQEMEENGVEMVKVPDVQYQDRDEAMGMLLDAGLEVKIKYEITGIVEGGKVTRQSVEAGETLVNGEDVTLTVEDFLIDWTESEEVEKAVRKKLQKDKEDIYASELLQLDEELWISIIESNDKCNLKMLGNCYNLTELSISGQDDGDVDSGIKLENIEEIAKLTSLKEVYFANVKIDNMEWISHCSKIKSFRTYEVYIDTLDVEKEIHSLREVALMNSEVGNVTTNNMLCNAEDLCLPENVFELLKEDKNCEQVTYLKIEKIKQSSIENINKFPNVKSLLLDYDYNECKEINFAPVSDLENISYISISLPPLSQVNLVNLESLKHLDKIQQASIQTDTWNSDGREKEVVNDILSNMSRVEKLSLVMHGTTDMSGIQLENLEGLEEISIIMPQLESFGDVQGLDNVNEIFLESYANFDFNSIVGLPKLEKLTIKNMNNCNFDVLEKSKSIDNFTIFHSDIEDISFLKGVSQLKNLSIVDCKNIQIEDLKDLSQIEHLYISDNYTELGRDRIKELRKIQ